MHRLNEKIGIPLLLFFAGLLICSCQNHDGSTKNVAHSDAIASTDLHYLDDTNLINRGKPLFTNNCGACHAIRKTDNYLAGIVDKLGIRYIKTFITKQDSLIQAKDEYAVVLKRAWGSEGNAHNFQFSEEQLDAIIAYINKYSE